MCFRDTKSEQILPQLAECTSHPHELAHAFMVGSASIFGTARPNQSSHLFFCVGAGRKLQAGQLAGGLVIRVPERSYLCRLNLVSVFVAAAAWRANAGGLRTSKVTLSCRSAALLPANSPRLLATNLLSNLLVIGTVRGTNHLHLPRIIALAPVSMRLNSSDCALFEANTTRLVR